MAPLLLITVTVLIAIECNEGFVGRPFGPDAVYAARMLRWTSAMGSQTII